MRFVDPKNLAIGALSAAVVALATSVAVDHTVGAPTSAPARSTTATTANVAGTTDALATLDRAGGPRRVLQELSNLIGVTPQQILADIGAGQTLSQIAGAKAATLRADIVAKIKQVLDGAVARGAMAPADESRLLADAADAVGILMNAKLGTLYAAR